jgi:hypothetical protein
LCRVEEILTIKQKERICTQLTESKRNQIYALKQAGIKLSATAWSAQTPEQLPSKMKSPIMQRHDSALRTKWAGLPFSGSPAAQTT